jgi:hypothetical protein
LQGKIFKLHQKSLFKDGTGPGLEPVGGEFQPSFEIVHPGGGAHLIFVLIYKNVTQTPLSAAALTLKLPDTSAGSI